MNFDDLDSKLYELEQIINIEEKIADFIFNNRADFYYEGEVEIFE